MAGSRSLSSVSASSPMPAGTNVEGGQLVNTLLIRGLVVGVVGVLVVRVAKSMWDDLFEEAIRGLV